MSGSNGAVAVVGLGSVGSILAAYLARAGHEVVAVEPGERHDQVLSDGLVLTGKVELRSRPEVLLSKAEQLEEYRDRIKTCFVCTKTWALRGLLPVLKRVLHPDTLVISFQNGIGPEDDIAKHFPREHVGRAVVNLGCGAQRNGTVAVHWITPPSYLGSVDGGSGAVKTWAETLSVAGLATQFVEQHEVRKRVFFKNILNSALNALCASSGITMRQAMQLKHTRAMASLLIREGLSVASAVGYNYGEDAEDVCIAYLDGGGDHLPSMWVDLERGNRTEIEYMNGKIVKIGQMFKNIDVDVNIFFTSMIVTLEIKAGARAPEEVPDYLVH